MKEEKKLSPNPEKIEEVLKADLKRTDTFILKNIGLRQNEHVIAARTSGEEIKKPTGIWNWIVMDRIENHFPTREVQGEMIRCLGEEGGTISSAMFQGPPDKQLQLHQYRCLVSPTLCRHLLSSAEMRIYNDVSNGHKANNSNNCEIPSGQENTRCTHTHSLCLHFTTLHKAS